MLLFLLFGVVAPVVGHRVAQPPISRLEAWTIALWLGPYRQVGTVLVLVKVNSCPLVALEYDAACYHS